MQHVAKLNDIVGNVNLLASLQQVNALFLGESQINVFTRVSESKESLMKLLYFFVCFFYRLLSHFRFLEHRKQIMQTIVLVVMVVDFNCERVPFGSSAISIRDKFHICQSYYDKISYG